MNFFILPKTWGGKMLALPARKSLKTEACSVSEKGSSNTLGNFSI